ncbi:TIGR02206 family membrane protein [Pseudonocardia acaciae]|uniref:YwaF family protein n=1 Tax=Pseudonocardia acaciae TaxID=551276 RepID=UPI00055E89E4|nr:TIGR02206 family membrane protein [Pseudonocardia acaciae]
MSEFVAYGTSHSTVLAVTVAGAAGLVVLGRHGGARAAGLCARVLAVVLLVLVVGEHVWEFDPEHVVHTLPLHLSDLAPYTAACALWTRWRWACALTYYWGITLSTQSLLTPALAGPDFPSLQFLVFFASHSMVVWAAIFLTWGLRLAPSWRGYWFTVGVTGCWAAATLAFNALTGTNYGFLNAKPPTGSILDLLGPWPWYLVPEVALLLGVWALMTAPWRRRPAAPARRDEEHVGG